MTVDVIRQRVQARLEAGLLPALLARQNRAHKKTDWRECDCSFCVVKREASTTLGLSRIRRLEQQGFEHPLREQMREERERI